MVSTREILYVLLITLAAGGGGVDDGVGLPYGGILPLLLLLLLSTDTPCGDRGCGCNVCCNNRPLATPGFFGRGF